MRKIKINQKDVSEEQAGEIAEAFNRGEVVVYPTDTIYGLGCLASNKEAINRVHVMKGTSPDKPLIVLVDKMDLLKKIAVLNSRQEEYISKIWQEDAVPTTFILESAGFLPLEVLGGKDTVAVRLPKDNFLIKLIEIIGSPIVSTSLNKTGEEIVEQIDGLKGKLFEDPDLVVDAGRIANRKSSRIIDVRDMDNILVFR